MAFPSDVRCAVSHITRPFQFACGVKNALTGCWLLAFLYEGSFSHLLFLASGQEDRNICHATGGVADVRLSMMSVFIRYTVGGICGEC